MQRENLMKLINKTGLFLLLGSSLLPQAGNSAGVHQHGVAQLDIVFEPPALTLALHSPLANLVGFEHPPATDEEQALWAELQEHMQQPALQLALPQAAGCALQHSELNDPFAAHVKHEHEHEHEHEQNDDLHDEHEHADLTVEYRFHCAQPKHLTQLELPLMQNYPGIEKLEVRMLTPSGQHLHILQASEQQLTLP